MHKHNLLKSMHFQVWKDTKTTQMKSLLCKGKFKKKRKKSIKACYTYFTGISSNLRSRLNQLFLECFWTDWLEFSSLSQFTVLPAFFVWTQLQLCEWFPLLILVTFIPLLSSYAGLLLLFLASFPKDGGCSAVASSAQMEHLRAPWKDLIGLVAHFSFFLVSFPVFTELLFFEVKHTCGGFFGLCCSCGGCWIEVHYSHCHRAVIPLWDFEPDPAHHSIHKQAVTQCGLVV